MRTERLITTPPRLPANARWVLPARRKLKWARYIHIVPHSDLDLTLCGRVRPGEELSTFLPDHPFCPRCLYRASALWIWP